MPPRRCGSAWSTRSCPTTDSGRGAELAGSAGRRARPGRMPGSRHRCCTPPLSDLASPALDFEGRAQAELFAGRRPPRGDQASSISVLRVKALPPRQIIHSRRAMDDRSPLSRRLFGVGPLGELGALFNPGMRHEIEERQSKANRREEEGNARDGDLRIDLASGVAVINVPSQRRSARCASDRLRSSLEVDSRRRRAGTAATVRRTDAGPRQRAAEEAPTPVAPPGRDGTRCRRPASGQPDRCARRRGTVGSASRSRPLTLAAAATAPTAARRSADGDRPARRPRLDRRTLS